MELKEVGTDSALLTLSLDELRSINNALNAVCSGFRVADFATKMGADRDSVDQLLDDVNPVCRHMRECGFQHVSVRLSGWEVRAIIGAMQEVCRVLDFDFHTIMGAERSEVERLQEELATAYNQMRQEQSEEGSARSGAPVGLFSVEKFS